MKYEQEPMYKNTGKTYYFIDGDSREFDDVAALYMAYMHKVCGLPETELYEVTVC